MANRSSDELTDAQWAIISPLLPLPSRRSDGKGRPRRNNREVLNGILWILRSGARWKGLPDCFPPYQTCHRRFSQWAKDGTLRHVLEALAQDLQERGELDLSECFIDGTFSVAKKGDGALEKPSGARAASSWRWQTYMVFLSPSTLTVLRRMKSPLSERLFRQVSPVNSLKS